MADFTECWAGVGCRPARNAPRCLPEKDRAARAALGPLHRCATFVARSFPQLCPPRRSVNEERGPCGTLRQEVPDRLRRPGRHRLGAFPPKPPLPQAMPPQRPCSSLSNKNCRAASRQAERRIEPFQVIWLTSDLTDFRNCLTKEYSKIGMHPAREAHSCKARLKVVFAKLQIELLEFRSWPYYVSYLKLLELRVYLALL